MYVCIFIEYFSIVFRLCSPLSFYVARPCFRGALKRAPKTCRQTTTATSHSVPRGDRSFLRHPARPGDTPYARAPNCSRVSARVPAAPEPRSLWYINEYDKKRKRSKTRSNHSKSNRKIISIYNIYIVYLMYMHMYIYIYPRSPGEGIQPLKLM